MKAALVFFDNKVDIRFTPEEPEEAVLLENFDNFVSRKTVLTERHILPDDQYGLRLEMCSDPEVFELFCRKKLFGLEPFSKKISFRA